MESACVLLWLAFFSFTILLIRFLHTDAWHCCHIVFHCVDVTWFLYPSPCEQTFRLFPVVVFVWLWIFQLVLLRTLPVSGIAELTSMHLFIRITKFLSKLHFHIFTPTSRPWSASCSTSSSNIWTYPSILQILLQDMDEATHPCAGPQKILMISLTGLESPLVTELCVSHRSCLICSTAGCAHR